MTAAAGPGGGAARLVWRLLAPTAVALALAAVLAPLLYIGTTDVRGIPTDSSLPPLKPPERLALVAMHRAGMAALSSAEGEEGLDWLFVDAAPVMRCGREPVVVGIAVAEAYARPAWRRDLEIALARLSADLFGSYPDWSYGLGQIQLSTARAAIAAAAARFPGAAGLPDPAMSDAALLDLLADPCANLAVARLIVAEGAPPGEDDRAAAARYRGGPSGTPVLADVSYEALVARVAAAQRRAADYIPPDIAVRDIGRGEGDPEVESAPSIRLHALPAAMDGPVPVACFGLDALQGGTAAPAVVFVDPGPALADGDEAEVAAGPPGAPFAGVAPEGGVLQIALQSDAPDQIGFLADAVAAAPGLAALGLDPAGPWRSVTLARAGVDDGPAWGCQLMVAMTPAPAAVRAAWGALAPAEAEGEPEGEGGFVGEGEPVDAGP